MLPAAGDLRYFLEITETGNISRAAERLGISQPSLSLAVKRLEEALGTSLLVRSKGGVRLTRAGERFTPRARALLKQWDGIRADTVRTETELHGEYRLGCHPSVALYTLPGVLPPLLSSHPSLELRLFHDHSRKVTERVISYDLDFGITVNPLRHPDLVIRPLLRDVVTFWIHPERLTPENRSVLICDPELAQTQFLLRDRRPRGAEVRRTVTSASLEVVAALTAAGAGIGILPRRVATRLPDHGLELWSEDAPRFHDRICLVYRADSQNSASSKLFAREIQRILTSKDP